MRQCIFVICFLHILLSVAGESSLGHGPDLDNEPGILEIHVSHQIIQRAAELASPIRLKGFKKTPIGSVPWTAIITNPVITITKKSASFVADLLIVAGPIKMMQKVNGDLEPHYLEKKNRIIIKPVNVTLRTKGQEGSVPGFGNLDLNGMIPDFEIPVYLPKPYFKIDKKTIKVSIDPKFEFVDDGLRISTPVRLTVPRRK